MGCPTCCKQLCPQDFHPSSSDPQNFQVVDQENTLALAQALQAFAEASGAKPEVLCGAVRELQQCMAPSMAINGDEIMEASLLGPIEEEQRPPTPEEETTLLGRELGPQQTQALFTNRGRMPVSQD